MEYGMLRSLISLSKTFPGADLFTIWDSRCEWRKALYPAYKQGKTKLQLASERITIINRINCFQSMLSWIVPSYSCEGCEADDVIAGLCRLLAPEQIIIVSTDKDMLQLASDRVSIWQPKMGGEYKSYTPKEVCEDWEVKTPADLRWVRAYAGDNSDNLPGCRVPKKLIAKCVDGIWVDGATLTDKIRWEQESIEKNAKVILTEGRKKQFLNFASQALLNHQIMCLLPPRLGSLIRCNYAPDIRRFAEWAGRIGVDLLLPKVINHFGSVLEVGHIVNPHTRISPEETSIPPSPSGF